MTSVIARQPKAGLLLETTIDDDNQIARIVRVIGVVTTEHAALVCTVAVWRRPQLA